MRSKPIKIDDCAVLQSDPSILISRAEFKWPVIPFKKFRIDKYWPGMKFDWVTGDCRELDEVKAKRHFDSNI
jgi:hypothetical protein